MIGRLGTRLDAARPPTSPRGLRRSGPDGRAADRARADEILTLMDEDR